MANALKTTKALSSSPPLRIHEIEERARSLILAIQREGRKKLPKGGPKRKVQQTESDQDNWAELFVLLQPPMLKMLRYVFGIVDIQEQDDLFQELMLRLYCYHSSYESSRPLLPWLYSIARNLKLDSLRKSRLRDKAASIAASPESPDITLKLIAAEVLEKLPEDDRLILWLSYMEGLTNAEISNCLERPLSTTKFYLREAKKRARQILAAHSWRGEKT
jgi:RNA polymerase sigma-70 factor (ECF subfamily)